MNNSDKCQVKSSKTPAFGPIRPDKCLILLLLGLLLASCSSYNVKEGMLRDTIFSVEETNNGNYRVFFTHDDVAGYCTTSRELGQEARSLLQEHDGEVIAIFTDVRGTEEQDAWTKSECGTIPTGADSSMAMFRLDDLWAVPARD